MSQNYPNLLISDAVFTKEAARTLKKMDNLCSDYVSTDENKEILDSLHSLYWQFLMDIIPSFIMEETKESFSIGADYEIFVNYGIISERLCPQYERCIKRKENIPEDQKYIYKKYKVIKLSDWIKRIHDRNIKTEYKNRLMRRLNNAEDALTQYPERLKNTFSQRDEFLEKYPLASEVVEISEQIDARLPGYNEIKEKIELSQRITVEERTKFVRLTEEICNLRDSRAREQQAISDKVPQSEMMRLDREIESIITLKGILEKELVNANNAVKGDQAWRDDISLGMCREMLRDELRRTRMLIELAARRSHVRPLSVFIENTALPQAEDIVDAIESILEVDPKLLSKRADAREKFPTILVVPIFGDGIYDFDKNIMFIPLRSPKGLTQAVATALIEYHLETESGSAFKQSYIALRKDEGIHSSIQLRERMLRDYIAWVTLEANGYQVMDKKTKQWFIENVAPSTFSLKHPRRLGDFLIAEAHELIAHYEEREPSQPRVFKDELRVGIAYWKTGQYLKANQAFINAFNLDTSSQDACYNAALSSFKNGFKQKAIEYWRAYLRLDKMSFWTVRVQTFLNTAH